MPVRRWLTIGNKPNDMQLARIWWVCAHLSCSCVIRTLMKGFFGWRKSGRHNESPDFIEARAWNSMRSLLYLDQIDLNLIQKKHEIRFPNVRTLLTHPTRTFRKWRLSNSPENCLNAMIAREKKGRWNNERRHTFYVKRNFSFRLKMCLHLKVAG